MRSIGRSSVKTSLASLSLNLALNEFAPDRLTALKKGRDHHPITYSHPTLFVPPDYLCLPSSPTLFIAYIYCKSARYIWSTPHVPWCFHGFLLPQKQQKLIVWIQMAKCVPKVWNVWKCTELFIAYMIYLFIFYICLKWNRHRSILPVNRQQRVLHFRLKTVRKYWSNSRRCPPECNEWINYKCGKLIFSDWKKRAKLFQ